MFQSVHPASSRQSMRGFFLKQTTDMAANHLPPLSARAKNVQCFMSALQ